MCAEKRYTPLCPANNTYSWCNSDQLWDGQCDCVPCSAGPGCGTEDIHRHPSSPPLRSPSLSPPRSPSSQSFPWFPTTSLPRANSKLRGWTLGLYVICFMSTGTHPKALRCVRLARFPTCSLLYCPESRTTRHGQSICIYISIFWGQDHPYK